ncbi:VOC family protein [Haloarchaeobius sp. TZWSO28]|uniref:VOC family protein n=1 Tax=unclassified Haloarchaeobius TaxID=2614452 RepID=UPI003EBAC0C8
MAPTMKQVYLMASDVERSTTFYEEALGLECTDRGDRSAAFETGACTLKIENEFDEATLDAFGLAPPGNSRGDGVIIVLEVEDVEAIYENAVEAGVEPLIKPREVDWGRKLFLVRDPDGYTLEVSQPM